LADDDTAVLMTSKDGRGDSTAGADVVNGPLVFDSSIKAVESACETWEDTRLDTSEEPGSSPVLVTLGVRIPVWVGRRSEVTVGRVGMLVARVKGSEAGRLPLVVMPVGMVSSRDIPVDIGIFVADETTKSLLVGLSIELLSDVGMSDADIEAVELPDITGSNSSLLVDGVGCAPEIEEVS
jgi:hypothetical protein